MTRTQDIESVRAACVKANEDIMKLEFGCRIEYMPTGRIDTFLNGSETFAVWNLRGAFIEESKFYKILGRDIQLVDVLMAVNKKEGNPLLTINCNGVMTIWKAAEDGRTPIVDREFEWRYEETLEGQSDETLSALSALLSNEQT